MEPESAAIREIAIENFRGIRKLSLSFVGPRDEPTDLVVLGGPNGSGKTTVLEACLIAASHKDLLPTRMGSRASHQPYLIQATLETRRGRVRSEHRPGSAKYRWESTGSTSPPFAPQDAPCAYFSSWRTPRLKGALPITAGKPGKRPVEGDENRLWMVKQYLVNSRAHEALGTPGDAGTRPNGAAPRYREMVARLDHVWGLFHPGARQRFSVEPASEDPEEGFDVFLMGSDNTRIPLDDLSSGQIELINFAGWTLFTKLERGIVCFDEPELHLDPQWHSLLLRSLREMMPGSQFIVGTHSPEVYDSAYSFQRHLLVPPDDARASFWSATDREAANR